MHGPGPPVHAEDAPVSLLFRKEGVDLQNALNKGLRRFLRQGQGRQNGQLPILAVLAAGSQDAVEELDQPPDLPLRRFVGQRQHMGSGLKPVPFGEPLVQEPVAGFHVLDQLVIAPGALGKEQGEHAVLLAGEEGMLLLHAPVQGFAPGGQGRQVPFFHGVRQKQGRQSQIF